VQGKVVDTRSHSHYSRVEGSQLQGHSEQSLCFYARVLETASQGEKVGWDLRFLQPGAYD
jgi:hypothetical protein